MTRSTFIPLLIIALLSAGLAQAAVGAEAEYRSRKYIVREYAGRELGLTGSRVVASARDRFGFAWIATERAVHRFDGDELITYSNSAEGEFKLPYSDFSDLYVDLDNRLWIAGNEGVARIDLAENRVHTLHSTHVPRRTYFHATSSQVTFYLNDIHPYYYAEDSGKLVKMDIKARLEALGHTALGIGSYNLLDDETIFFTLEGSRCLTYHIHSETITPHAIDKIDPPLCHTSNIFYMLEDHILIATQVNSENHLLSFDKKTQVLQPLLPLHPGEQVYTAQEDANNTLWIASNFRLMEINQETRESFEVQLYTEGKLLDASNITDIFVDVDGDGDIWLSSREQGALYVLERQSIQLQKSLHNYSGLALETFVASQFLEYQGNFYIFSPRSVACISAEDRTIAHFKHTADNRPLPDRINKVIRYNDDIFVAADDGLYTAQLHCKEAPTFSKQYPRDRNQNINVIALDQDSEGQLWLGTAYAGLTRYDPRTKMDTHYASGYPRNPNGLLYDIVTSVYADSHSRGWFGTVFGLSHLEHLENPEFTNFLASSSVPNSLCGRIVEATLEARDGTLWFATSSGLARYHEAERHFSCITERQGLPSANVLALIEDSATGHLWAGSAAGLSELSPSGQVLKTYGEKDGLFGGVNRGGLYIDRRRQLWVGTERGINVVPLSAASHDDKYAPLVITKVYVNNHALGSPLNAESLEALQLAHYQNNIQIDLAHLNYAGAKTAQFYAMLQGWDNQWRTLNSQSELQYANLPSGQYHFQYTIDPDDPRHLRTLAITIAEPLWYSWWAYLSYVLIIAALAYALVKLRTRHLESRAKILEQKVQDRVATIEKLLREKDELFANISHEFRTPLTLILGPADQLRMKVADSRMVHTIDLITANARRLLRMVDQLLDMARLDSSARHHEVSTGVNLGELVTGVLKHFDSVISEGRYCITTAIDSRICIRMVSEDLEKIFVNLLSNAIKYSPNASTITIRVGIDHDSAYLMVSDEGTGIAPENQRKIFERFVRVGQSDASVHGSGIGLALVKQIIDTIGGSIAVANNNGPGVTFTVYFPAALLVESATAAIPPLAATALELKVLRDGRVDTQLKKQNEDTTPVIQTREKAPTHGVLIVEDNPQMQRHVAEILQQDFEIMLASDGAEGFECTKKRLPDLIVTDLMMPKVDGMELAAQIRSCEMTSHIPILMLTAKTDLESRKHAWKTDIDEYIEKPFDQEELRIRCHNLINIRELISLRIGQAFDDGALEKVETLPERDRRFLEKLEDYVSKHFADSDISANSIAAALALSESQLQRKIKALTSQSIPELIRNRRLKEAKILLSRGKSISDTASEIGFGSASYFSSCFKARYGMAPKEFQSGETSVQL